MIATYPPNYLECDQLTPEWFVARAGHVGSSRIADAIARLKVKSKNGQKGDPTGDCLKLRRELAWERLTGRASEHYVSKYMEDGREREPEARTEYELRTGASVDLIGYVYHPTIKWAGASPDGLVGDDGLVEFKCPKGETHLGYMDDNKIPDKYVPQMFWQLICTGRKWNDFVSYNPELPDDLQLFVKRMEFDWVEDKVKEMEEAVIAFNAEVDAFIARIRERNRQ